MSFFLRSVKTDKSPSTISEPLDIGDISGDANTVQIPFNQTGHALLFLLVTHMLMFLIPGHSSFRYSQSRSESVNCRSCLRFSFAYYSQTTGFFSKSNSFKVATVASITPATGYNLLMIIRLSESDISIRDGVASTSPQDVGQTSATTTVENPTSLSFISTT